MLPAMLKLLAKWLLSAAALLFVAYVYSGVEVKTFTAAMVAALVIGLLNTIVRPILVVLTLPVTVVTLGLFLFVINALMFWAAAGVLDGFHVSGFLARADRLADLLAAGRGDRVSARAPVREAVIPPAGRGCR